MKQLIILAAALLTSCSSKSIDVGIELQEVNKRCVEELFDECVYGEIVKTFKLTNREPKDIKAISFTVYYLDILNNVKGQHVYSSTRPVEAGSSKLLYFTSYYNKYSELDHFMLNSPIEDIRTKVSITNVIYFNN